ncbi:MAG: D-alanine--D-alanine ligase family protein [Patescibacteria group bacterium]|jgi:D-alanine-D-alanine ligase
MKKKIIGIICGGRTPEHAVSLLSAQRVFDAIDKKKFSVRVFGVDSNGSWWCYSRSDHWLKNADDIKKIALSKKGCKEIVFFPGKRGKYLEINTRKTSSIDIAFPLIHGGEGEDGSLQGFLKLCDITFVGSHVASSAVGMDKEYTKRILQTWNIPVAPYLVLDRANLFSFEKIKKMLGGILFLKPARCGSSVGVSKVTNQEEWTIALKKAIKFDSKVLVEQEIIGREIECAVLGNENPRASVLGEIVVKDGFYSYEAKYVDQNAAELIVPCRLHQKTTKDIQEMAKKAFIALGCRGMARIDFFLDNQNRIFVNEINTTPGFTSMSMYPKLWGLSGIAYQELIEKLIVLATK